MSSTLLLSAACSLASKSSFSFLRLESRTKFLSLAAWRALRTLSYAALASLSVRISRALESSWNSSAALGLSGFLSGWHVRAFFL
uniref:Uncharacterized protein n=1 Tax=Ixodes ricinus TaxID=34613 RepID=A0A6B0U3W4_IXORI